MSEETNFRVAIVDENFHELENNVFKNLKLEERYVKALGVFKRAQMDGLLQRTINDFDPKSFLTSCLMYKKTEYEEIKLFLKSIS